MFLFRSHSRTRSGLLWRIALVALAGATTACGRAHHVTQSDVRYDNFRRVDAAGNPLPSDAPGDPAGSVLEGQSENEVMLGAISGLQLNEYEGFEWVHGKSVEHGVLTAPGTTGDVTADAIAALKLTGYSVQPTAPDNGQPTDDQVADRTPTQAMLQQAYRNYLHNKTCKPTKRVSDNLVDTAFGKWIDQQHKLQFADLFDSPADVISITTTAYKQMVNVYTCSDEWVSGKLVSTTERGTLTVPGNDRFEYVWHRRGI